MERKPERKIDLFFFEYESYYDENDDYVVRWKFDWIYFIIAGFIIVSLFVI